MNLDVWQDVLIRKYDKQVVEFGRPNRKNHNIWQKIGQNEKYDC